MYRIKESEWDRFRKNSIKLGFEYQGNHNRGDNWIRANIVFDYQGKYYNGIMIQGKWAHYQISYWKPYADFDYPPIENYIQDLIEQGYVEKVEDNNG